MRRGNTFGTAMLAFTVFGLHLLGGRDDLVSGARGGYRYPPRYSGSQAAAPAAAKRYCAGTNVLTS